MQPPHTFGPRTLPVRLTWIALALLATLALGLACSEPMQMPTRTATTAPQPHPDPTPKAATAIDTCFRAYAVCRADYHSRPDNSRWVGKV